MKIAYFFIVLLISTSIDAKSIYVEGMILNEEELTIEVDKEYKVPKCRKWLLKNVQTLGESKWLERDGILQIQSSKESDIGSSNFLNGKFTYSAGENVFNRVVVYPESKVTLRSIDPQSKFYIGEITYDTKEEGCFL